VVDKYTKDQEGSGIGLALTKELVELHHGKIIVKSLLDKGTTFTVFLPLGKDHLKSDEMLGSDSPIGYRDREVKPADTENFRDDRETEQILESNDREVLIDDDTEKEDSKPLLLIVEDNDDLRSYIRSYLTDDYRIIEAIDGEMGLEKSIEKIPDLVISDVMMPKMDGMELSRKLKTDERTSHIPIILLTAKAAMEDKLEGLETGADDFLTKPFDQKELLVRIRNLIQQRRKLKELFIRELDITGQITSKDILSMDRQFLQKAKNIVEENMSDFDFNIENFAEKMCLSRVQLHRKLKALINQSASEFLRIIRLNHAAGLIRSKSGNITQITFEVGFNNLSYFSKCFKEQFGMLPSEYANQNS
jgi:DNA-binding response OmpR family regulator